METPIWINYASNIGNALSGLGIVVIVASYLLTRRNTYLGYYSQRIERTFGYILRLQLFQTHFANIYQYIEYKKDTSKPLNLTDPLNNAQIILPGSEFLIRQNLIEVYTFLKEVNLLMRNLEKHKLIDKTTLIDAFEGFKIDINNFFKASFEYVANREIKYGKLHGIRGDFTRENLVDLVESLKNHFKFVE